MTENMETKLTEAKRAEWINPEISVLDIQETQNVNGVGGDGDPFPDCTRS